MCFGSKDERNDDPPPRPAQQHQQQEKGREENKTQQPVYREDVKALAANNPYANANANANLGSSSGSRSQQQTYAPPPDAPPPFVQKSDYLYSPPSAPPPGHQQYAAPPGPPPSHQQSEYAPPTGPPPGPDNWIAPPDEAPSSVGKAAEHDWQAAVPDTSLFPPPPAIFSGYDYSPANNATEQEANAGEDWCVQYPLTVPMQLDAAGKKALLANNIRLIEPVGFNGKLNWLGTGHWEGRAERNSPDRCIIGYPPLYLVNEHDPTRFGAAKTIYYEVKIHSDSRNNFIGMGFTALPYPSFRLPGWHRGSLGVHGDDGHKYINDRWGGKDFTHEFRKGETLGIGMTMKPTGTSRPEVTIFFTRDGAFTGSWDLHEETDAEQDLPVTGLEGFHDLSCAIGTFDSVHFEVVFDPAKWKYKPM